MWGGKAQGGVRRRFIDAVGARTGASQALAHGWARGAATGSEADGVEPLTALEMLYAAGGGGGPAGSQSAAKHRRRRWCAWRLRGGVLRQSGRSGLPPFRGRNSGGAGAGSVEPITSVIASRNAGKHPSGGINPRLRAPDPTTHQRFPPQAATTTAHQSSQPHPLLSRSPDDEACPGYH